jgi:hypothetical protein
MAVESQRGQSIPLALSCGILRHTGKTREKGMSNDEWRWFQYYSRNPPMQAETEKEKEANRKCAALIRTLTDQDRGVADSFAEKVMGARVHNPQHFFIATNIREDGSFHSLDDDNLWRVATQRYNSTDNPIPLMGIEGLSLAQEAEVSRILQFQDLSIG